MLELSSSRLRSSRSPRSARAATTASEAKEQVEFGIKVAQNGLWNEAAYRWEKAVETRSDVRRRVEQPRDRATSSRATSTRREKAYEKALELDPKNLLIRQNYDLFKEINDRTKRRRDR